jgi:hypothetical protein
MPDAFQFIIPFADRTTMLATGICRKCCRSKNLEAEALRHVREIWPDAHRHDGDRTLAQVPRGAPAAARARQ